MTDYFLACESTLKQKAVRRKTFSSAFAGGEGFFNLGLKGSGVVCIESDCPREELVEITLEDDVVKIDGNLAVAWSGSLDFTVERAGNLCSAQQRVAKAWLMYTVEQEKYCWHQLGIRR